MTTYQDHVKREMPKLRGQGMSAGDAMKELARTWREGAKHGVLARGAAAQKRRNTPVPRVGGARASKRQSHAMLDQLPSRRIATWERRLSEIWERRLSEIWERRLSEIWERRLSESRVLLIVAF